MATHTTQTMSADMKTQNSSKYQPMYENLMNEDYPFRNLDKEIKRLKKEKMKQQTK